MPKRCDWCETNSCAITMRNEPFPCLMIKHSFSAGKPQADLSWSTILKAEGYRKAFANFKVKKSSPLR